MNAHRRAIFRFAVGTVVALALLSVQLYLYSPWHLRPAQGRQYCCFFPVEQGNALEASGPIIVVPPATPHDMIPVRQARCAAGLPSLQQTSRAPPA